MRAALGVRSGRMRIVAAASVILVLNLCAQDVGGTDTAIAPAAAAPAATTRLASLTGAGRNSLGIPDFLPLRLGEGADSLSTPDSTGRETAEETRDGRTPVYRKWWFWAGVGGAIIVAVVLGAMGGGGDANLPDFPDPPER